MPTWPNWLGDLATWGAAGSATLFARKTFARLKSIEDRESEDERRVYARNVFAHHQSIQEVSPPLVFVTVSNLSHQVIHNVEVRVLSLRGETLGESTEQLSRVSLGQRQTVRVPCLPEVALGFPDSCRTRVDFTDAEKVRWYRIGEDAPVEIGAPTCRRSPRAAGVPRRWLPGRGRS